MSETDESSRRVADALLAQLVEMHGVDEIDDLHMARQQPLHQRHRPGFERLGQQRMIGVGESRLRDAPGLFPFDAMHVDEKPHQFGDADRRMRVVELDRDLVGELTDVAGLLHVAARSRSCSEAEAKKYSCRSRSSCPAGVESLG